MNPGDDSNRRHAVSFSLTIRSPRAKRSRLARPPTPPPACEESAHYPVFNPQDPRHNPALRTSSWLQDDYHLQQAPTPLSSVRWMQSLPGRSLRRARSGLQALRSGIYRRPIPLSSNSSDEVPRIWSSSDSAEGSSDHHEGFFSSAISDASTEEDIDFGTDLYRTGRKYPVEVEGYSFDVPSVNPCSDHPCFSPTSTGIYSVPTMVFADTTPISRPMEALASQSMEEHPATCDDALASLDSNIRIAPAQSEVPGPASPESPCSTVCVTPQLTPYSNEDFNPAAPDNPGDCGISVINSPADATDISLYSLKTYSETTPKPESVAIPITEEANTEEVEAAQAASLYGPEAPNDTGITGEEPEVFARDKVVEPQGPLHGESDFGMEYDLGETDYYLSLAQFYDNDSVDDSVRFGERPHSNSPSDAGVNFAPVTNTWLSIEKDDLTSLSSWKDEYFLVDGKSNDLRPDPGDNPTKADRITSDGGIYSGPGLDRNLSMRAQDIPEIIGPVRPVRVQPSRLVRAEPEGSDSTDEYLATYSLFQRHYLS